ncbi:MAG: type II toxin-antitoxin system HicB family antitoxin [Candidatus Rokubacteria bacterium]|nr:type II toxin-antitoxin system HicB family antitoxin [Candidatus Rokubacteria bacterium]
MIRQYVEEALKRARYDKLEDGIFCAEVPRGVLATGETLEECRNQLAEVVEEWVLIRVARGLSVPPLIRFPFKLSIASGPHPTVLCGAHLSLKVFVRVFDRVQASDVEGELLRLPLKRDDILVESEHQAVLHIDVRVRELHTVADVVVQQNDAELRRYDLGADLCAECVLRWCQRAPRLNGLDATLRQEMLKNGHLEGAFKKAVSYETRSGGGENEIASRQTDHAQLVAANPLIHSLTPAVLSWTV